MDKNLLESYITNKLVPLIKYCTDSIRPDCRKYFHINTKRIRKNFESAFELATNAKKIEQFEKDCNEIQALLPSLFAVAEKFSQVNYIVFLKFLQNYIYKCVASVDVNLFKARINYIKSPHNFNKFKRQNLTQLPLDLIVRTAIDQVSAQWIHSLYRDAETYGDLHKKIVSVYTTGIKQIEKESENSDTKDEEVKNLKSQLSAFLQQIYVLEQLFKDLQKKCNEPNIATLMNKVNILYPYIK